MGGFIAQALALGHPNRVHKLILLSTDPGGG
jgi:pimeloyl-ACP methyl ester carboxylesterase